MVFLKYTKEKSREKESGFMLNDKICRLREELNNSIITGQDYSITYDLSIQLDQLIAEYYRVELDRTKEKTRKKVVSARKKVFK